jgi:hypothetical protein
MAERLLAEVVRRMGVVFARRHVRHAQIGGLAVGLGGRERSTVSVGEEARTAWLEDTIKRTCEQPP